MSLLILCCAPAAVALFIILGISLNQINPWAGKPVPQLLKDAIFVALIVLLLDLVLGGVR